MLIVQLFVNDLYLKYTNLIMIYVDCAAVRQRLYLKYTNMTVMYVDCAAVRQRLVPEVH